MKDWIGNFIKKQKEGFETGRLKKEQEQKEIEAANQNLENNRQEMAKYLEKQGKTQQEIQKQVWGEEDHQLKVKKEQINILAQIMKLLGGNETPKTEAKDSPSPTTAPKPTPTPAEIQTPSPITPTPTTVQQMMGVGDTGEMLKYYGDSLSKKLERDLPILKANAAKNGMPLEYLLAQWWQESSFGTNPNTGIKNSATALGDMQITDAFTNPNKPAYPKFPELYIAPNDRLNLDKSTDFTSKYYSTMSDYLGSPDKAISSYYGDPSYLELIKKHAKSPQIQSLLEYLKVNQ